MVVQPFTWQEDVDKGTFSTTRGFVFQYPPFPALDQVSDELVYGPKTAGLYLHMPFCPYHCSFCYYVVQVNQSIGATERYLTTLEQELELLSRRGIIERHSFQTVFIGGGTPTYLNEKQLIGLIDKIGSRIDLSQVEEFTIESDPTTLSVEKIRTLRSLGVNRLSIGIQSFSTEINLLNERKHSEDESLRAIEMARSAGITNLNLDLICGLIGSTDDSWEADIDRLLNIGCEHVTIYLFSFRPQTTAYKLVKENRMPLPPNEPARVKSYLIARRRLLDAGYIQTTPNCFVREPQYEQIHQRNAWSSLPLIGVGVSAYSFIDNWVIQNTRSMKAYYESISKGHIPIEIGQQLNSRDIAIRYCILRLKQLRLIRTGFRERFGFDVMQVIGSQVNQLTEHGLIELDDVQLSLTERGIIYVDDVCRSLYTSETRRKLSTIESLPSSPLVKSLV